MSSPYWPLAIFAGRNYAETARTEYKIWANHVAGAVPPTDDPNSGAVFTSDGTGGLIANNLYYRYPSNGVIIDLTAGGGGGGVSSIGPVSLVSTANALSIAGTILTAHVGSAANYGVIKGVTTTTTTLGAGAGASASGTSIVIGSNAGASLTTGSDNVILGGDVDIGNASNRIVLGNITGAVDDQVAAPITSMQFAAGFLTHTETDVLTISATGLVRKTPISTIAGTSVFVNPITDHGAVGDGVADDTAAIEDSIDDAQSNGKLLYLPKGTFRLTSTISKAITGLSIYAHAEAVLDVDHATNAFTFTGNNFSMRGGSFTTDAATPVIFSSTVSNVDIQDVKVTPAGATSFLTSSSSDGINILNCNTGCSLSIGSTNTLIAESRFTNVVIENDAVNVNVTACVCDTISTSVAIGTEPQNVIIEGCKVTPGGANNGISIGNGDGVVVSNNCIDASGTTAGGMISVLSGVGAVKDAIVFSKNTVVGGTLYGLSVGGSGATIIENNTFRDNTGPGIQIEASKANELVIKGNVVKGTHTFGISLPVGITEYIIDGNRLSGSIQNSATSATKVITNNIV